ncbi:MBL fold metallo-hydrolase [Lichenifustis flavocetrariae]|uniref:MBL fold metallo-hydrolase n=1 Tax=Lichenifustis flavocetrariae TaxID=2949735 RepID=A0AA42CML7_9HYPH|nr:MBL fold metallo-hydrolase [Lichenifustis flavocetrariae]MCW6511716.1 MBL fold metallo-hydrolase [Lichenifustis flavocetrariae]
MTINRSDERQPGAHDRATAPASSLPSPLFRFQQGDFDVTVLSDGFIWIPDDILLSDGSAEQRASILPRLDARDGMVRPKTNIPLIRKGEDVVLIDIGAGHLYQPSDGMLADNLKRAEIDPSTVTKVVFSHAHPDHIWATLDEHGSLRYPNAEYYIGAAEWEFWMDPDYLTKMPPALHEFARGARRDLEAVKQCLVMLKAGDDVVTGLRALDTPGHTPGHLSFELAGGDGLLIAVDVANNEVVSFEHPDWRFGYDTIPELGVRTRRRLLDRAANERTKLLGYHWGYPGLGFAERHGEAFHFSPAI